jgi:hypothetical protein
MTRASRSMIAALGCVLTLTSPLSPRLLAAASDRAANLLQQYGEVTLRDLPRATPQRGARSATPFRPTNPDTFGRKKSSRRTVEAPLASTSAGSATVAITEAGFDGVSFAEAGALPPDTQIAVGPDHVFEAVNDWVRIWSRQTVPPSVVYDVDLGTFFGVGFLTTLTDIVSDPRVIYDRVSGRWFVSCVTLETLLNRGDWRLAVSKTSDPTGAYTLYAGSFSGRFPDFPSLGLSDDKLVLTGNAFTISTEEFLGSEFLVENKADLVAGVSAPHGTFFGPPQAADTIQAAQSLSPTSTLFLAAVPSDGESSALHIWSIDGVPGVGTGVSVSTTALTQQTLLVIPPDALQPNSSIGIATNDARLLNLVYRDGSLWMGSTTGCTPAGDTSMRACLHFMQVDTAARAVTQEITFGEPGVSYYYPAVVLDANDNMVTVFNRSSSSEFVSVYVSGHNASDAVGSFQAPTLVRAGLAAYDPSPYPPRWGDYSGISVDPFDFDASIWVAGEYVPADGGLNWGTWIAKVSAGTACALPSTPTGLVATPSDARVTLTWSASPGAAAYTVKRATTSGGPYTTIASGLAATTYTDAGLTNGTTYYYVVAATNACGESANPAEASATPIAVQPAPAAPTKLSTVSAKGKVKLSWTQSTSPGVTQNKIYRSTTNGGPYAVIASIGANTTYTDTQVTGGTTYYYVVTAVSGNGESAPSNQDSAKPK